MPDRAKKKERQRLKRKEKQLAHRKAASISPFARLAKSAGEVRCWWNPSYPEYRQAQIMVLREMPNGSHAMAAFLVDLGVVGLKDAWGRLDITPAEFHAKTIAPTAQQFAMTQVNPDDARGLIAGAIRFAHDNGFRLPHRYERWVAVLGGVGDWHSADTSQFDMEFAGSIKELRQRLIGQPVEDFIRRTDVAFTIREDSNASDIILSDGDLEVEEELNETAVKAITAIRNWCASAGQTPEPQLEAAWNLFVSADVEAMNEAGDLAFQANIQSSALEILAEMLSLEPEEERTRLVSGITQIGEFAKSFEDPSKFVEFITGTPADGAMS